MHITLLHLVSSYFLRRGLPAPPWNDGSFDLKRDVACGTIACANWLPEILHQIESMIPIPTYLGIDATLAAGMDTNLLGPFNSTDARVEPFRVCKMIYLPTTFFGIFLERDITPAEAWICLCGAIADIGQEVDCRPIIYCIRVTRP